MTTGWFASSLDRLPAASTEAAEAVAARAADILRPPGALRRLDELAVMIAGWHGTSTPSIARPAGVVFAGDHGVALHGGVSAYPTDVTAAMLTAFREGRGSVNAIARSVGASVTAVDVGVGDPTGDIRYEPALDAARFDRVIATAVETVDGLDTDLLVVGEMGIGNTTVAAAVARCLLGGEASAWVGRGTGVDDQGVARKIEAVERTARRVADAHVSDPIEVLRHAGGAELVAIAAAVVAARSRSIPVVLDGYVATAAVLPLFLARPDALDHCIAGHCSSEPGHRRLLAAIGLEPLIDLDLRLGEASGAMAAVPLIRIACATVVEVPTFTEWFR